MKMNKAKKEYFIVAIAAGIGAVISIILENGMILFTGKPDHLGMFIGGITIFVVLLIALALLLLTE